MRVLHILNTSKFSGAENVVCQIINMFKSDINYDMAYCSFDGEIRQALSDRGIVFFPVPKMSVAELKQVINRYRPDVVHAHDMKTSFIASMACGKTPVISHIHNNAFDSRGISLKSIAYYLAAKKARRIIWVSKSSFEGYYYHKYFKNKSVILYNVIDQNELFERMHQDSTSYEYDVVYVGRMSYAKNPERLLKIIRLVCDKMPQIKIAIIGTGELDDQIKLESEKLKLAKNVTFLGFKRNPLKVMHDSKVMVMTSRWEGTPMVALEALALGVPIISTPTDGMNELIENGINGYLSDNNATFAHYLQLILEDEQLQKKLSNGQLDKSKKINDIKHYKKQLNIIYHESVMND